MMKRFMVCSCIALALIAGFVTGSPAEQKGFVLLASTIGPIDSGIVDVLEQAFETETGIRVRHIGMGTGATLKLAQKGAIDLVMVHARSLEEKFVAEGYGTERIDLMYNDFVIVGPPNDPAGIRNMKSAVDALRKIAQTGALFISRGDRSGTHVAEMNLWSIAGVEPKGAWYEIYEKGSLGNGATLKYVSEKSAYTAIDRATFLSLQKQIHSVILVENDEVLLNFISLIPVNPKKFPNTNLKDAMIFVNWLTAVDKGQKIIQEFGKDRYGASLFFPNSKQWKQHRP
ncbi:substrate-binding domain-containing protein [Desulfatirhabdium butyrativorans]|uniref:substrate-binding domain-containing protein n=1 Tax=Desulfatirhabdium butyrativorans TaxID=340467 RepID=UPI0003FC8F5D|nr:substrate-binding domain-containing protein [Desulfatirhabdium butyrativorans]